MLLFLDEIQATPQVIESLKYFYEESSELPLIASGSLLDFALEKPKFSLPVGRIEYFLISQGDEGLLKSMYYRNKNAKVIFNHTFIDSTHRRS